LVKILQVFLLRVFMSLSTDLIKFPNPSCGLIEITSKEVESSSALNRHHQIDEKKSIDEMLEFHIHANKILLFANSVLENSFKKRLYKDDEVKLYERVDRVLSPHFLEKLSLIGKKSKEYMANLINYNKLTIDCILKLNEIVSIVIQPTAITHGFHYLTEHLKQQLDLVQPIIKKFIQIDKQIAESLSPRFAYLSDFAYFYIRQTSLGETGYQKKQKIGEGSFGKVYILEMGGFIRAGKYVEDQQDADMMIRGALLAKNTFFDRGLATVDWINPNHIFMELGGKSVNQIKKENYEFLTGNIWQLMHDLIRVFSVLHAQEKVYLDLNLNNILCFSNKSSHAVNDRLCYFKLCDFDSLKILGESHVSAGTYYALPPEAFESEKTLTTPTKEMNAFGIGMIIFYILNNGYIIDCTLDAKSVKEVLCSTIDQKQINLLIDVLKIEKKLIHSIGKYAQADFLKLLGKVETQKIIINMALDWIKNTEHFSKYQKYLDQYQFKKAQQLLLSFGIDQIISQKGVAKLYHMFVNQGLKIYTEHRGETKLFEQREQFGTIILDKITTILKGLLVLDPRERRSVQSVFDEYFSDSSSDLVFDMRLPESHSLFELE